ncbi:hypothetical protein [Staphylococcus epidermidis]|uniref:hypothetical protein n=1 Tax=Staphylococcus epidermidis TaxID=1282 RepID=UPI000508FE79|nr:hypothetical protein [Staphylococcus epidermidis]AIR81878.1 hypothetical protein DP17_1479 [Staphylococcus epidermidis]
MNNDEMNKLSEALELSEAQKLALYNYNERQTREAEQQKPKELSSLEKHEKKQKIMSIKDANQRQEEIAKNIELFK